MGRTKFFIGFRLLSVLDASGLIYLPVATGISIKKGDAVNDNGSGYATNVLTAFDSTFQGVAAVDADNTSGANGAIEIAVIPPLPHLKFMVPNESATVAAQTDVGETVDLESEDGIDVTDTTITGWGFHIDEIDISDEALAVENGGFVIGRFLLEGDQA